MKVKIFTSMSTTLILLLLGYIGAFAQSQTITGKVTDSQGQPLPGVTILIKNTAVGTTTESNGTFSLTSPQALRANDVLLLPKGEDLMNNGIMPVRFHYPTTVQTNNTDNYKKAVESMGGDDINTKVWWEKLIH